MVLILGSLRFRVCYIVVEFASFFVKNIYFSEYLNFLNENIDNVRVRVGKVFHFPSSLSREKKEDVSFC